MSAQSAPAAGGPRRALILAILLAMSAPLAAADLPQTKAEASNFTATSTHAEVMAFIRDLQARTDRMRVETLGTSTEGREIPLLVIGNSAPSSPAEMHHDKRAVVYFQADIHAGEVEGKDAALMVARELTLGDAAKYLDRLVVLIAPIFNPDGNDKINVANRTNQNGPAGGVGDRFNGQNLDLNRDGVKLETPEVRGLVQQVLTRWDPVFFLDSHTHNGSYHQEPVTWIWGLNPNGDAAIFDYMAGTVWPAIEKQMRERYHTLTLPHGDFLDVKKPELGWTPLGPEPRYLSNYVGLRNRLAVLDEQYPYVDFATRVKGAHDLFLTFIDFLSVHRDEAVALVSAADRRTIARGANPSATDVVTIDTEPKALERKITIQGWEMEVIDTGSRYPKVHPTDVKRTYKDVPYLARYAPTKSVPLPRGYVIGVQDPAVIGKLREHGIVVQRLVAPATLNVEVFSVTKLTGSQSSDQGHYPTTVEGKYERKDKSVPAGSYFVSTAQPLGSLAAQLLEPESKDGLVVWNFFDRYLAFQWIPQPMEYPVYKLYDSARLVTDTVP